MFANSCTSRSNEQITALNRLVGVWEGSYVANQGETGLTLDVYMDGGHCRAIFDFYNLPGKTNAKEGKYVMRVSYNTSTQQYYLRGHTWVERPDNYRFVDLEGTITGDDFSGSVVGLATFRVARRQGLLPERGPFGK